MIHYPNICIFVEPIIVSNAIITRKSKGNRSFWRIKMRSTNRVFSFSIWFLLVIFASSAFASGGERVANTIGGFVFDKTGVPLSDIDVELLDELYRLLPDGRRKTDAAGRYQYDGLNDGNYTVKVYAFRFDFEDQSRYVEIKSLNSLPGQTGSSYNPVDFYLIPRKGSLKELELGVVFAQDVPKAAETAYKKALDDYSKKKYDESFTGLQQALTVFPNYYYALERYAGELVRRGQYWAAAQVYMRAAGVNPKSGISLYNAGYCFYKMGDKYYKNALAAAEEANKLAPASYQALRLIGMLERRTGKFAEAEKHLLEAKKASPVRDPEVQIELAQLYANDLKKFKEAADELEIYVKAVKLPDADEKAIKEKIVDLRAKAKAATPSQGS